MTITSYERRENPQTLERGGPGYSLLVNLKKIYTKEYLLQMVCKAKNKGELEVMVHVLIAIELAENG